MNIHEYQAKEILNKFGVAVLHGGVAYTPSEAKGVAREMGGDLWVVKAQIHAGGRGKAGGVKVVKSLDDVEKTAKELLGKTLVTHQTGPKGKEVKRVFVEEGCAIASELYLGMLIDRETGCITILASTEGGVEIEEVARKSPKKILKIAIDPLVGMQPYYARKVASGLGLGAKTGGALVKLLLSMYRAFTELDCSQIEINPLVITKDDAVIALDAKINFDDNALFRHKDVEELRDEDEEDPVEREAERHSLNYINLDGNIGCMVNGAGLAMATMDIIKLSGGDPANFLDVGGGATRERVTVAFKLILSDPNVEGVMVNIFGGIMRCDAIADGIVAAAREVDVHVPLVVRLEGTNVDLGKKILSDSGLAIIPAETMADAADKIVRAVKEAS